MKRKAHPHEHVGELNIVPYLDIMVNLVMFMLMSMSGFVTFQMINTSAPDVASDVPQDVATPPPEDKKEEKFVLNVSISRTGFYIAATGGVLPGIAPQDPNTDPSLQPPTVPLKKVLGQGPDGKPARPKLEDYDFVALNAKMQAIKTQYPKHTQVFIAADPSIPYEAIVGTMDATRGDQTHPLFPDVAFGAYQN